MNARKESGPKNDTREAILREATDLFAASGYWKTSIRDVAGRLNIPNTSIYYYFKNKEYLLFEVIELSGLAIVNELEEVANQKLDPIEKLASMFYRHMALNVEHKNRHKVFIEEGYHLTGKLQERIAFLNQQIYNSYYYQIEMLGERGHLNATDYSVVTFTLLGTVNWVYRWFKDDGKLSVEEATRILINTVFLGILKKSISRKAKNITLLPPKEKSIWGGGP
jgi:AcrR family transcriptional regulator